MNVSILPTSHREVFSFPFSKVECCPAAVPPSHEAKPPSYFVDPAETTKVSTDSTSHDTHSTVQPPPNDIVIGVTTTDVESTIQIDSRAWVESQFITNQTLEAPLADKLRDHIKSTFEDPPYMPFGTRRHALFSRTENDQVQYRFTGAMDGISAAPPVPIITQSIDDMASKVPHKSNPNSGFVNGFKNGKSYVRAHSDMINNEPEDSLMVALGATREFCFKHKTSNIEFKFPLVHGHIYHISDLLNIHYTHSRLKDKHIKDFSASLTTREL